MDRITIQHHIEEILKLTLRSIQEVYEDRKEDYGKVIELKETAQHSRLVFPCKGGHQDNNVRISEQEFRFAFVEQFNLYCNDEKNNCKLFYSVETPTRGRYHFPKGKNVQPEVYDETEEGGQSAAFDMTLYDDKMQRVCLIEFKAHNVDSHDYLKDYAKLRNSVEGDENVLRYFINVLKTYTDSTIKSINDKISEYPLVEKDEKRSKGIQFKCYVLEPKTSKADISDLFICK